MWIEKLTVENFRLFEKKSFSFHPEFNLIVGENGSGKTTAMELLASCVRICVEDICSGQNMGVFVFPKNYVIRTEINDHEGELRNEYSSYILIDTKWQGMPVASGYPIASNWRIQFHCTNDGIISASNDKFEGPRFKDLIDHKIDFIMPLFALYPCNRLWSPPVGDDALRKAMEAQYTRYHGYFDWEHANHNVSEFMLWIQKPDIIAYQEKAEPLGWRVFQQALRICLEGFERLHFMAKEGQPVILFDDKRRIPFKQLSDGQRTIFALIGELGAPCDIAQSTAK